ncbi:hypothetical protein SAMN04515692_11670 [Leifsonia sp. CL147]|uniref:hypothetical protein n=1 Tax=Leifsonia sp. CL154 TaxID=1798214 RepID=UPI0008A7F0B1|nr:hypothetical protein [Leifsonia sp. CL154]SEI10899.1 hypothetical protein SAMN04515694_1167 [Leifsonia sp. CL154]SFL90081.1 hypothetical protein SAMN04515692_11670 [Leifsonia sp. CL147]
MIGSAPVAGAVRHGPWVVVLAVLLVFQVTLWTDAIASGQWGYFPIAVNLLLTLGALSGAVLSGLAYLANLLGTRSGAQRSRRFSVWVAILGTGLFVTAWASFRSGFESWGTWRMFPALLLGSVIPFLSLLFWPPGLPKRSPTAINTSRRPWFVVGAIAIVFQIHTGMYVVANEGWTLNVLPGLIFMTPTTLVASTFYGLVFGWAALTVNHLAWTRTALPRLWVRVAVAVVLALLFDAASLWIFAAFPFGRPAFVVPDLLVGFLLPMMALLVWPPGLPRRRVLAGRAV